MGNSNKNENKQLVADLAEILNANKLNEIEFQQGEIYIKLRKSADVVQAPSPLAAVPIPQTLATPINVNTPVKDTPAAPAVTQTNPADNPKAVKSPMVGVAYLTPEPNSPNYVKVGDTVTVGQTLLLVEAMKTFNPVKSPRAGKVTAILVKNGAPVEFDEPLMIIE